MPDPIRQKKVGSSAADRSVNASEATSSHTDEFEEQVQDTSATTEDVIAIAENIKNVEEVPAEQEAVQYQGNPKVQVRQTRRDAHQVVHKTAEQDLEQTAVDRPCETHKPGCTRKVPTLETGPARR